MQDDILWLKLFLQDDVAPAVAPPQTPESLPVDPRHMQAPKTPTNDDMCEALTLALEPKKESGEEKDSGEDEDPGGEDKDSGGEEKDSDIDSDKESDDETCAEALVKQVKTERTEQPKAKAKDKITTPSSKAKDKITTPSSKKRTRIQMIQDLTNEDEIAAPVPTQKDAGICQVLESLV